MKEIVNFWILGDRSIGIKKKILQENLTNVETARWSSMQL